MTSVFTREDVEMLRECAKQQKDIREDYDATAYAGDIGRGDDLAHLAERIEALLPPESP